MAEEKDLREVIKELIDSYYESGIKKSKDIYKKIMRDILVSTPALKRVKSELAGVISEEVHEFVTLQKRAALKIGKEYPTIKDVEKRKRVLREIHIIRRDYNVFGLRGTSDSPIPIEKLREMKKHPQSKHFKRLQKAIGRYKKGSEGISREDLIGLRSSIKDYPDDRISAKAPLKELVRAEKQIHKEIEDEEDKIPDWEKSVRKLDKFKSHSLEDRHGGTHSILKGMEKNNAFMDWYNEEMENLRTAYKKDDISPDEFRKGKKALRDALKKETGIGAIGRGARKIGGAHKTKWGMQMSKLAGVIGLIAVGVTVTATTGSWYFFAGFLGIALYLMAPNPKDIDHPKGQKLTMMSWLPIGEKSKSTHNTAAFFRSLGKVTAIICFSFGMKDLGSVFNILYIAVAVGGYFLLKVEYDPDVPAEFIESVFRFFVGIFFIPQIFVNIFGSWVLGAIALAFFAVPPLPSSDNKNVASVLSRGLSGATAYYEMFDKFIFGGLMMLALIGSGSLGTTVSFGGGWALEGALKYTFIYFWVVTAVAGFFSPAKERPVTGAIMLAAATIIYGIGPGSQLVGEGLLGDWWPTVQNSFSDITSPMAEVMGSMGNTFSQGFLLLTNPVGYATQLMNGSYSDNPSGKTGAYGVDITGLTVTNILPRQPFVVTAIIENQGAYEARNVRMNMSLKSADKFALEGKSRTDSYVVSDLMDRTGQFDITSLGFKENTVAGIYMDAAKTTVYQCYSGKDGEECKDGPFSKLLVWQVPFQSTGVECKAITGFGLRKKFIPIMTTISYDYQSDSRVEVEFISQAEWQRLAEAGELDKRFRDVQAEYSSAPVVFPIGTAGLKNPILENQQFHISMLLASALKTEGEINKVEIVELNFPTEWELIGSCTPESKEIDQNDGTVIWRDRTGGAQTFNCQFKALSQTQSTSTTTPQASPLGGAPSKTYIVTAKSKYTFSRWKTKDTKIEFGGFCCADEPFNGDECKSMEGVGTGICESQDCLDGQKCINHACVYSGGGGQTATTDVNEFCDNKKEGIPGYSTGECGTGMGGCNSPDDCFDNDHDCDFDTVPEGLICKSVTGISYNICCPIDSNDMQCASMHSLWKKQKTPLVRNQIVDICNDPTLKTTP